MKTKSQPTRRRGTSRSTTSQPIERYSDRRIAEFLLNNAIDARDYAIACADVRKLGLDPTKIDHVKPPGVKSSR